MTEPIPENEFRIVFEAAGVVGTTPPPDPEDPPQDDDEESR